MKKYAFFGADSKTGTTSLAQSAAEIFAGERGLQAMLIHCRSRWGMQYLDEPGETLEGLRLRLENHVAVPQEILGASRVKPGYYVLGSGSHLYLDRRYHPDQVHYLLEVLKDHIDVVCLDCGCDPDDPLAVGGLREADRIIGVLTQNAGSLQRLERMKPFLGELGLSFSCYALNRCKERAGSDFHFLREQIGETQPIYGIAYSEQGQRAEEEGKPLLGLSRKNYGESVRLLCGRLLEEEG